MYAAAAMVGASISHQVVLLQIQLQDGVFHCRKDEANIFCVCNNHSLLVSFSHLCCKKFPSKNKGKVIFFSAHFLIDPIYSVIKTLFISLKPIRILQESTAHF